MKPVLSDGLSIFFPVYNERDNLEAMVASCVDVFPRLTPDPELILVDDGSSDGSGETSDRLAKNIPYMRVIHHSVNQGYGAALQSGFRASTKPFVFYTDGDRQFDVADLEDILPEILKFDVVSCYRLHRQDAWFRIVNAWIFNAAVNMIFGLNLRDPDCAYKIYKREVLNTLSMSARGALIDVEMLLEAKRKGFKIYQTGVKHYPRSSGRSTGADVKVIIRAAKEIWELYRRVGSRFFPNRRMI